MKKHQPHISDKIITQSVKNQSFVDIFISDPERKIRVGIKEIDDLVKDEYKKRRIFAPSTTEEKMLIRGVE